MKEMTANEKVKVSIITYVYVDNSNDRLKLFRENLESVAAQKYPSYEHVVVDDGSKVNIKPLVGLYPNTVYIRKQQSGITGSSYTFNMALENTRGEYVAILSSDDLHLEHSIQCMVDALEQNPDWLAVCGAAIYSTNDVKQMVFLPEHQPTVENLAQFGCFINGCAVMFRKSMFKQIGMPPHFAGSAADFDLWLRAASIGKIGYISNMVVDYRDHPDSTRKKTAIPKGLKPKEYEIGHYTYEKPARIMFVINSAVKRLCTVKNPKQTAEQSFNTVKCHNQEYHLDYSEYAKLQASLKKIRNNQFVTTYKQSQMSAEYAKVVELIDEIGSITFTSLDPVSVVLSHCLSPSTKQKIILPKDYKYNSYVEYFNWGFVDEVEADESDINYLGLVGMVNKQNYAYIDGLVCRTV